MLNSKKFWTLSVVVNVYEDNAKNCKFTGVSFELGVILQFLYSIFVAI
jgi:hypothetical protein